MTLTITQTTADALWNDPLPHGGAYTPPVGERVTGSLELDGALFEVIRDQDIPADRKTRLRARLPLIGRRWWR
jgi:hypothetical protein